MVTRYLCPVCGYDMEDPPADYNICPSCGTEFANQDINSSIPELRKAWLHAGPIWWSKTEPQPGDWNPFIQLAKLEVSSTTGSSILIGQGCLGWGEQAWDPQSVDIQYASGHK
jgi:rubredoxin